jgi:low temperature requirement protein LtrA
MAGWVAVALVGWPVWALVLMVVVELLVPAWAESSVHTAWHPEHIAERYGLFTIIVLGETILSSSLAFQAVVDARSGDVTVALTALGALLTVFSMWWIYFAPPSRARRLSERESFPWGYVHYVVFASAAAVGAGVAVVLDRVTAHHPHVSAVGAAASFTVPVIFYVIAVTFIHTLLYGVRRDRLTAAVIVSVLVAAATFTGQPVLVTGVALAGLVAALVTLTARRT